MAPFPETEIMTIKRLEVALRKSNFKLLKDGAYKLHEKFHSGHYFEYTDLLKEILDEVSANASISSDIKDILIPTINDILSSQGANSDMPANQAQAAMPQNRVSSLTSLSYELNQPSIKEQEAQPAINQAPPKLSAFDAFSPNKPAQAPQDEPKFEPAKTFQTLEAQPAAEQKTEFEPFKLDSEIMPFENPIQEQTLQTQETAQKPQQVELFQPQQENSELENFSSFSGFNEFSPINPTAPSLNPLQDEKLEEKAQEILLREELQEPKITVSQQEAKEEAPQEEENLSEFLHNNFSTSKVDVEIKEEIKEEAEEEKSILIFYGQSSSAEKIKNITRLQEIVAGKAENSTIEDTIALINEINTQANTNVSELKTLLDQLRIRDNRVNLITNSQSANLVELLISNDLSYSIFDPQEDKKINLMPLLGLTNLFECNQCTQTHLDTNERVNSYILQCPKCKGAMYPDLYTPSGRINMEYYNSSIIALANSDIWLLIHPLLGEKLTMNMMRMALKVSSKVKYIYILDKDINARETYKNLFRDINSEVKINTNISAVEDFFNSIS